MFGCVVPLISGSGVINVHLTSGLLVALRIWTRVLRLVWQTLYHSLAPAFGNFSKDKIVYTYGVQHSALMCVCVSMCESMCVSVSVCIVESLNQDT